MGAPICTTASVIQCPHGGMAIPVTSNALLQVQGAFALMEADVLAVAGCPFTVGPKYSPCVTIRWSAGSAASKAAAGGMVLQTSVGACYSAEQAPQGVAVIAQAPPVAQGS